MYVGTGFLSYSYLKKKRETSREGPFSGTQLQNMAGPNQNRAAGGNRA
jgi:hypothetical protein